MVVCDAIAKRLGIVGDELTELLAAAQLHDYEYLSYHFANASADIAQLFTDVAAGLGLRPRVNRGPRGLWNVRINRRESVARLLREVPAKA